MQFISYEAAVRDPVLDLHPKLEHSRPFPSSDGVGSYANYSKAPLPRGANETEDSDCD